MPQLRSVGVDGDRILSADAGDWMLEAKLSAGLVGSKDVRFSSKCLEMPPIPSSSLVASSIESDRLTLSSSFLDVSTHNAVFPEVESFFSKRAYHGTSVLAGTSLADEVVFFLIEGAHELLAVLLLSLSDNFRFIGFFGAPKALNHAERLGVALCGLAALMDSEELGSPGISSDTLSESSGLADRESCEEFSTGQLSFSLSLSVSFDI